MTTSCTPAALRSIYRARGAFECRYLNALFLADKGSELIEALTRRRGATQTVIVVETDLEVCLE